MAQPVRLTQKVGNVDVDILTADGLPVSDSAAKTVLESIDSGIAALSGGVSAVTILCQPISESTSGDRTIITPTAGKALRIRHIAITAASAVALIFKLGAASKTGAMTVLSIFDSESPYMWSGAINEAFKINLGSSVAISGYVLYYEV